MILVNGNEVDCLIWCENCNGYLPMKTEKDYKCPNCGTILRKTDTLDQFMV